MGVQHDLQLRNPTLGFILGGKNLKFKDVSPKNKVSGKHLYRVRCFMAFNPQKNSDFAHIATVTALFLEKAGLFGAAIAALSR
jgi:hypothetical protein